MSFTVSIESVKASNNNKLEFTIKGNNDYGFNKSIINGIRRTLLSEIPCVAFRTEEGKPKDIIIETNNTSLHNEFLLHRIAYIPIYLDPNSFEKQYIFYINVKHDTNEPFKFVTTDDIQIFPLKSGIDVNEVELSLENYDMNKPLSKKEKHEIFRPYEFRGKQYPILILELKSTDSPDIFQELIAYGSPSVSDSREDSRWSAISNATYTFSTNKELFKKIANDKTNIKKILDDDERQKFVDQLFISEGERYYFRDNHQEPNQYDFTLESVHYKTPKELFILANEIIISKLDNFKNRMIASVSEKDTNISIDEKPDKENIYQINIYGENDTLGNILQSHIVNHHLDSSSVLSTCGYRKAHPLEEYIYLIISLNPVNKVFSQSSDVKVNTIVKFFEEVSNDLIQLFTEIIKESQKSL